MHFFDCFLDDFYDEKYMAALSDLDIRAQVEASQSYITESLLKLLNNFLIADSS